jgi:phosphoribosylformylglycinamidine cyclo-ligase
MAVQTVDYNVLDRAKLSFIEAARRTLGFASAYGFVPSEGLGASANLFALDLSSGFKGGEKIFMTLVPEGLGTADDSRPEDLSAAELTEFWYNIGIKTVAVMTNDVATSGLQTILIGLYLPSSTPETVFTPEFMQGFLNGVVDGCRTVGCVYLSGETPQLKTKIIADRLDIAGAAFGLLPAGMRPVDSSELRAGDWIVLVDSSGPHENGFTTLRQIASKLPHGYRTKMSDGRQFWQGMNAPSILYTPLIQAVMRAGIHPTNLENITGHGWQKLMRPKHPLCYRITNPPPLPPVFELAKHGAGVSDAELYKIFNCGAGLAIFVRSESEAHRAVEIAASLDFAARLAGRVENAPTADSHSRSVVIEPLGVTLGGAEFLLSKG